jgi:hypothetical protein
MSSKKNVWVTGNRKDGYRVVSEGASRAMSRHATQREAVAAGRFRAKKRGVELIVQAKSTRIRQKDSHGPDRFPPRG